MSSRARTEIHFCPQIVKTVYKKVGGESHSYFLPLLLLDDEEPEAAADTPRRLPSVFGKSHAVAKSSELRYWTHEHHEVKK